jgi:hypothetical protein
MTGCEPLTVGEVQAVHGLAVDVELQLVARGVPDPDRGGSAVTLPVVQRLLVELG